MDKWKRVVSALGLCAWVTIGIPAFAAAPENASEGAEMTIAGEDEKEEQSSANSSAKEEPKQTANSKQDAAKPSSGTQPKDNAVEKEFKEKTKKLEDRIKAAEDKIKALEGSVAPNGILGIAAIGALTVSLVGVGLAGVAFMRTKDLKVQRKRIKKLEADLQLMNSASRSFAYERDIETLEDRVKVLEGANKRKETAQVVAAAQPPVAPQPAAPPKPMTLEDEYAPFVAAYNDLMQRVKSMGVAGQDAKKEFVSRFQVRAFSCVNYTERVNRPDLPPRFADASSALTGNFWAFPVRGDTFAVVPNIKTYEGQLHDTGGLKEAFISNFMPGKTFQSIYVVRPAIFGVGWASIVQQGELRLS